MFSLSIIVIISYRIFYQLLSYFALVKSHFCYFKLLSWFVIFFYVSYIIFNIVKYNYWFVLVVILFFVALIDLMICCLYCFCYCFYLNCLNCLSLHFRYYNWFLTIISLWFLSSFSLQLACNFIVIIILLACCYF